MQFNAPVRINEIVDGSQVREIRYEPDRFDFGNLNYDKEATRQLGYAGFRVLYPINQEGKYDEAESLLHLVKEHNRHALLDLAWLYERKNDLEAALKALDEFIAGNPGNSYAEERRSRIRAKRLEPEELVSEMGALAGLGEEVPAALFPEFVQRLFETGQSPKAREEIMERIRSMDARTGVRVAWVCYQARAYDLACTLFLAHLGANKTNVKYLVAMEAAADMTAFRGNSGQ